MNIESVKRHMHFKHEENGNTKEKYLKIGIYFSPQDWLEC